MIIEILLTLISFNSAATISKVIVNNGKDNVQYNIAGYSSYNLYQERVQLFLSEKLKDVYSFILEHNKTGPAALLSRVTPDKLVFLQLLHSFDTRNSHLNSFLYCLSEEFLITDPKLFKDWMDVSFDFPPSKVLNMINYVATEKINLTKNVLEQSVYLSEKYKVFESAASIGDSETVRWLLANGLDIQTNGASIFENAWQNGQTDIAVLIMKQGNIKNLDIQKEVVDGLFKNNETLLHLAVQFGLKDIVNYFVRDLKANVNSKDLFGMTPLDRSVELNKRDITELLITLGADVHKEVVLADAIQNGHLEVIKALAKFDVLMGMKDDDAKNLLFLAVERSNADILQVLALSNGGKDILNATNDFGDTLMHIAASKGFIESVTVLKKLAAAYDVKNNYGQTPLYKAVENGNLEVVSELIAIGADINTRSDFLDTLMHLAASRGRIDLAEVLIEHGAKIDEKNSLGQSPFYKAAQAGKTEMMHFLLSKGVNICNVKNGLTILHEAASLGNDHIVRRLIEDGYYSVDVSSYGDVTPLHLAAEHGHFKVAKTLLEKGADPNATTKNHWTPMHYAANGGHGDIVELLLNYSAKADIENEDGKTPLQLAIKNKKEIIAGKTTGLQDASQDVL